MGTRRKLILRKMVNLHSGLLRFSIRGHKKSLPVNVLESPSPFFFRFSIKEKLREKFINKPASLAQATGNGYLYLSGTISSHAKNDPSVFSMNIYKAHWFEKKPNSESGTLEEITLYG